MALFALTLAQLLGGTALAALPKLIAPAPPLSANSPSRIGVPAEPLRQAKDALARGEPADALSVLRPLRSGPVADRAALLEAEAWLASGQLANARRAYDRALKASQNDAVSMDAAKGLAVVSNLLGDRALELKYLDALLEVRRLRGAADLRYRRVAALAALGRRAEAAESAFALTIEKPATRAAKKADVLLAELKGAGVRVPAETSALALLRAQRLVDAGASETALTAVRDGALKYPRAAGEFGLLEAELLRRQGRDVLAERVLRRIRRDGLTVSGDEVLFALGRIALARDDNPLAEAWFGALLAEQPKSKEADEAQFLSAWLPFRGGRFVEGVERMRRFAEERKDAERRPEAIWYAAFSAYLAGDRDLTIAFARQIEAEYPASPLAIKAAYWLARAHERFGEQGEARRQYEAVSARSPLGYYGFLARRRLEARGEASVVPGPAEVAVADAEAIVLGLGPERPFAVDRALAFAEAGLGEFARQEAAVAWTFLRRLRGGEKRGLALDLLRLLGAHREEFRYALLLTPSPRSIFSGDEAAWVIWRHAYPRAEWETILAFAEEFPVDPHLVLSVMRTESHFDPLARSHVGAAGLMQLLPVTAERIGEKEPRLLADAKRFRRPESNVRLGAWYIHKLVERYRGQVPLAIAAYNAGPAAVDWWLADLAGLELDEFVERIPYRETRAYVQRVLESYFIYRHLDREPPPALPETIRRTPPRRDVVDF